MRCHYFGCVSGGSLCLFCYHTDWVIVGVLITGLPMELSTAKEKQSKRRRAMQKGQMDDEAAVSGKLKTAHKSTFTLLRNFPFMMIALAQAFEGGFRAFAALFTVLYVENMFR